MAEDAKNELGCVGSTGKRQDYLAWDEYFMATALLTAKRSKDPVTQVGACIVDNDKRIVAVGYNGFPNYCSDDEFPWTKQPVNDPFSDKNMYVVHAEANAILNRNAMSLRGTTLFTTLFPCNECAKLIVQSGIQNVRFLSDSKNSQPKYEASRRILDAANVSYTQFHSNRKHVTINFEDHTI